MKTGKFLAAAAAVALSSAPAFAAPVNPASSLSLSQSVRAGSAMNDSSGIRSRYGFGLGMVAFVLVFMGAGVYFIADGNESPDSN